MDKKLKILKVIDQFGWIWSFIAISQQKYSKHEVIYKRRCDLKVDDCEGIDIIYFHYPYAVNELTKQMKQKYPKLKIVGGYGGEHQSMYNHADLIISVSLPHLKYLNQVYVDKPVIFFPQGVETELFSPKTVDFTLTPGFAGRNKSVKRTQILDKLAFQVKKIEQHGTQFFVENRNRQPMVDFYHSINCLLLCSSSEGLSNVTLEAMSCGLPIISTDVGSVRLLLSPEWIVPVNPEEVVVKEINNKLTLLKQNPKLIQEIGQRNREHILKYFDWKIIQPLWDELFEYLYLEEYDKIKELANNYLKSFEVPQLEIIDNSFPLDKDISKELTVFVLSCENNPNLPMCLEALKKQTVKFKYQVLENITPLSKALQQMIDDCTTPFYVEVDDDMILNENAIEKLYEEIKNSNPNVCSICYRLFDVHLNKSIIGIRIHKHDIFKNYSYRDKNLLQEGDLNSEVYDILRRRKFEIITNEEIIGKHSPIWTPKKIFERYNRLINKQMYYESDRGYGNLEELFIRRLHTKFNCLDFIALMGIYSAKYFKNISYAELKLQWENKSIEFLYDIHTPLKIESKLKNNPIQKEPEIITSVNLKKNIILKVDDFEGNIFKSNSIYNKFLSIIEKNNTKISLGIIGKSMVNCYEETIQTIKNLIDKQIIEPYNHSYNHMSQPQKDLKEFYRSPFQYQNESILNTQKIVKEKLSYTVHVFGAVSNNMDNNTTIVLNKCNDLSFIYVYMASKNYQIIKTRLKGKTILNLNGYGLLESVSPKEHILDIGTFKELFNQNHSKETMIYQLHPNHWSEQDLINFEIILNYLISNGCKFIFPTENHE